MPLSNMDTAPIQQTDQYEVSDPLQSTTGNTSITGSVQAPTPDGQMPSQSTAPTQTQNPQAPQGPQPNAPLAAAGQSPNAPPNGPASQSQTRTQRLLANARAITDQMTGVPYKTTIDPNTGETTRTPQPLNARAIGLSLVLEALQGGLAGAGAHGPNAVGEAAQAGLQQGEKIGAQRIAAQAQQDQQAQTDLRNKQQVVTNLLQTRQLALSLGRQSMEQAQESVKADAPAWEAHQEDPTSIYGQDLGHDDAYAMLNKLGLGNAQVIITGTRPRTDSQTGKPLFQLPTGQIVPEGTAGAYQAPDFTYAVVKPDAKVSLTDDKGNLLPQYQKAVSRGYMAANLSPNTKLPPNFQQSSLASQAALRGSQIADTVQDDANKSRAALGLPPINIDGDLQRDPNVRQATIQYNAQLNAGATHAQAMQAVANGKYASAAGTIQNWYGGADATKLLDQQRASTDFDNGIIYGHSPIVTRQDADRAVASSNPKVQAAGKAAYARMDAEAANTKRLEAQATEGVSVAGQEQVAAFKNKLAQQGGDENPNFNETPNAQGVRQNYLNSLPNADEIRQIGQGDRALPMDRSPQSVAIRAAVSHSFTNYNQANYPTWQKTKVAYTSGPQSKGVNALNQALLHGAEAYNNVTVGSTIPGLSAVERWSGNDQANGYNAAIDAFAGELGTAVKGGVLDQKDAERWIADVRGSNPASARSKIRTTLPLIKARLDTLQQTLNGASVAGTSPIQVLHADASHAYDRINGTQSQGGSQSQPTANQPTAAPVVPAGMIAARINGQVVGYKNPNTGQVTRF